MDGYKGENMNYTCCSNVKDPENRSKKDCCCGRHNHSNAKRNKNHNSTFKKLLYREGRRLKERLLLLDKILLDK